MAAAKVTLLWPTATLTLAGTVKAALLLLNATELAVVAVWFKDKVQVLVALLLNVEGAQDTDEIWAGAEPVSVKVLELPFKEAVSSAV